MLKPEIFTSRTHKERETNLDCQDSVYPEPGEASSGVFAVADGATQSFFPRHWAQQLTRQFGERPDEAFENWAAWLNGPQRGWHEEVAHRVAEAPDDVFASNDFQERRPAAATFVGLRFHTDRDTDLIPWEALVLGDSCLFHLQTGGKVDCHFKKTAADFSFVTESAESYPRQSPHHPKKLCSSPTGNTGSNGGADARSGDVFLLATDAFSKWMLARDEARKPVWGFVARLASDAKFQELVAEARADGVLPLENDDVALVVVRFGEPHAAFAEQKYEPTPAARTGSTAKPAKPPAMPVPEEILAGPKTGPSVRRPPPPRSKTGLGLTFASLFGAVVLLAISLLGNFLLVRKSQKFESDARKFRTEIDGLKSGLVGDFESSIASLSKAFDRLGAELHVLRTRQAAVNEAEKKNEQAPQSAKLQRKDGFLVQANERGNPKSSPDKDAADGKESP